MGEEKVDYVIDLTAIENRKDTPDLKTAINRVAKIMAAQPSAWAVKVPWNEIAATIPAFNIPSIRQSIVYASNALSVQSTAIAANLPGIQAGIMNFAASTKLVDKALSTTLSMKPILDGLIKQMNMVSQLPTLINSNIVQALLASTKGLKNILWYSLPDNLKPVCMESNMDATEFVQEIVAIGLTEGIPFFCIVNSKLAGRLFRAKSEQERRKILSGSLRTVLRNCSQFLDIKPHTKVEQKYISLLQEAISVIEDGHLAAGTTLLAQIGETLSGRINNPRLQKAILNQRLLEQKKGESKADFQQRLGREEKEREKEEINNQDTRTSLALAPMYPSFVHYHLDKGDSIPFRFSRHAVSHNIDKVRFSKVNAAQGLLSVFGLACYLFDWDIKDEVSKDTTK
ncbi:hypothetical protein OZX72_03870 [Bifidobacterium sp. ESL0769]|uniref:hypothetical protein n=1 Tax=Bifidobacterium sp. ESL0769 TaxID=2983229 RepID=UPI0023F87670|nr:hypothetical protein [Bifidobacterium sp. ESL0769]WEV68123.1 hypothetical protein OZX72_03870 [Bifidobacterium sp. ESL0769]